jgi:hypothetical protein
MKLIFTLLILISLRPCFGQSIDSLSVICLKLELYKDAGKLNTATGFIVEKNNRNYLITNLHVVSGIDFFSKAIFDAQLRTPNLIGVWFNTQNVGEWNRIDEPLYDRSGKKRWIECSFMGKQLDLIALPLGNIPQKVKIYSFDTSHYNSNLLILPGFSCSIIGFPNGLASDGAFAIWKTGHIASDMVLNLSGIPQFMIDATTRPGMSGSIVVIRMSPYIKKTGGTQIGIGTQFLGIYTAQSSLEEIGYVLKPIALKTLMDQLP